MDDKTGIRIALVASIAAVLISVPTAGTSPSRPCRFSVSESRSCRPVSPLFSGPPVGHHSALVIDSPSMAQDMVNGTWERGRLGEEERSFDDIIDIFTLK